VKEENDGISIFSSKIDSLINSNAFNEMRDAKREQLSKDLFPQKNVKGGDESE
jgi:hypothetical protein